MTLNNALLTGILSLSLLFGIATVSQAKMEMRENRHQLSRIEQPLSTKILVTLGGLGLIGAELWWFLVNKTQSKKATLNQGIQEIKIVVDGGYSPDRIQVNVNQPVRLHFLRKDPSSCLEKVLIPNFHKALDLPLNQVESVEFTPIQTGQYTFHCGMNMFRGIIEVQNSHYSQPATPNAEHHSSEKILEHTSAER